METDRQDKKLLELQFVNLVSALAASAMQQLGKLVNPLTGKTETNLQGAKATIDLLEMLREKTAGNLNEDEANLVRTTISTLQLNYVDEAAGKKDKSEQTAKQESGDADSDKGKAH